MSPLDRLTEYLQTIERRLRVLALTRGAAISAAVALALTVGAVLVANYFAFSDRSVLWGRIFLFFSLALAIALGLAVPALTLSRRRAAREAEQKFPQFEQRLLTFSERAQTGDPFLELLASDTLEITPRAEPERVAAPGAIFSFATAFVGGLLFLLWLGTFGPGFWGYGTALLWGGLSKNELSPFYDIVVEPGNRTVRRKSDQIISARLVGFQSQRVLVRAKYDSSSKWEEAAMTPQAGGPSYEFLFTGVPESLDYYIEAAGVRSKHYRLNVVDLPGIKRIRVTYNFPAWTGMKDVIEDPGGDLRAVEGTTAQVAIETDRPLNNGALLLDNGGRIGLLEGEGNWRIASVPILKDGLYHIAQLERGETVRLSDDYFIEAHKDSPPIVRITRPGGDAKVNPIEEMPATVEAQDDFGLQNLELHYFVNGAPAKTVSLLPVKGQKQATGSTTIYLEEYKMSPGDVISMYATASDAHATSRTDMLFIEARPFEYEYSQSQQSGPRGAGGGSDERISQRQKEIIAATWNQIRDKTGNKAAADNAQFLSGVQSKLRDQAKSLASRMRSRELASANQEFKSFVEDMEKAAEAMEPASAKLRAMQWQAALAPEQKALQHLLRAEAAFRKIQVAFGRQGQGGGGGRDLESLFDLELDTEKNQYESGQQGSADQRARQIDETLQKLEQLARRQQEIAQQQRQNRQSFQQRWQQEMLRRELEELQRKVEQLARSSPSGQPQQGQQSSAQQGGQSQLEQAIERMRQATRDMRQAGSSQNGGTSQSEAEARRAAERLQEARDLLAGIRRRQVGDQVEELARKAEKLAEQQQSFSNRIRQMYAASGLPGQQGQSGNQPAPTQAQSEQLAQEKQRMLGELERLEREMQEATRNLAGSQRAASSKLRDALGTLQQQELAMRMRWAASFLRRGLGAYVVMREAPVTRALNELRDQLRDAQRSLGRATEGQKSLEQALAQAERLRQQMERQAQQGRQAQGRGQQEKQGQPGQAGQPGQQAQSGQAGQPGQQAQRGNRTSPELSTRGEAGGRLGGPATGGYDAMNRGDWQPADATLERGFQESMRDLLRLERALEGDREMSREVQDLVAQMRQLDPKRFPGNPELLERLQSQALIGLEQLELELRRKLDIQSGNVRSGAGDPVPTGYADSVAEYFKKLSKEK